MPVDPERVFGESLDTTFFARFPRQVGVAVSGGGDSMALLHMAAAWCAKHGVVLHAATVNHGLRPEAAAEAGMVAEVSANLGIAHQTLFWQGWDGQGNLQAAARAARGGLLTAWATGLGLEVVLLGHTADDQAETVLMRLARGSGVDGLAGMAPRDPSGLFLRPLLDVPRAALRDWLRARNLKWAEDPSNDDPRFDRVKARQMLATLEPLGLTRDRLIETAAHMARAETTLWQAAARFVAEHVQAEAGDLLLAPAALALETADTPARVLAAAIQWIGTAPYRPRYAALEDAARALQRGDARTLGGVRLQPDGAGGARLGRELAAVQGPVPVPLGKAPVIMWDGRWIVASDVPAASGLVISALGEAGYSLCPEARGSGLSRMTLLATPAVWQGDKLVAAPFAGLNAEWTARLCLPFDRFIVSH